MPKAIGDYVAEFFVKKERMLVVRDDDDENGQSAIVLEGLKESSRKIQVRNIDSSGRLSGEEPYWTPGLGWSFVGAIDLCVEEVHRRPTSRWKRFWVGTEVNVRTGPWTEDFRLAPSRCVLPVDGHLGLDAWDDFLKSVEWVPGQRSSTSSGGELATEIIDEVVALTVKGPFGWRHTYDLKDVVTEHVEWGYLRFVIDINQSGPMDATAVSQLVHSFKTATDAGGIVVFVDSREKSTSFWKMTTLNQIIDFYPSSEDALGAAKRATILSD